MNKDEALEMLKALKFNRTVDLNKIPEMCDYFFNNQSQLDQANKKLDEIKEYIKCQTKNMPNNGCKSRLKDILSIIDGE